METEDRPLGSEPPIEDAPKQRNLTWFFLITALLAVCMAFFILVPNFLRAKARGQLTACKSNLKNIATALEMYASDHQGYYPEDLEKLTPVYLKTIPTCPALGAPAYTNYEVQQVPAEFSFGCVSRKHQHAEPGYPRYHSQIGLIERP